MGRERPRLRTASAAPSRFGGVAHAPHIMSVMCWGARLMVAEICALMTLQFPGRRRSQISRIVAPTIGSNLCTGISRIGVAPVLNFPGALGRVKASFADAHRLRGLDPPSALPSCCNYRSDGEISNSDSL